MPNPFKRYVSCGLTCFLALALGAVLGCTGNIGAPGGSWGDPNSGGGTTTTGSGSTTGNPGTTGGTGTGGTGMPPGMPGAPPVRPGTGAVADPTSAGPMPLRRLNRFEYNNTVRDLLGVQTQPADSFPLDFDGFDFRRAGLVSSLEASVLRDAAEKMAAGADMSVLGTCAQGAAAEEACARTFMASFGLRAFRRPLTADEITHLVALYQAGRTSVKLDHPGALRLVIEGMLQSPPFLYRWELGTTAPSVDGKVVRLNSYEVASRLSYFLWGSMPDASLFDAATANQLGTPAEVELQARRLLADPKARSTVSSFFEQWLNLERLADVPKSATAYPDFNDAVRVAMAAETRAFVTNVVFDGDGLLGTLLTAKFSFVNGPITSIYGLPAVQGAAPQRADLDPTQRAGLFTQTSFLTLTGSPDGSNPVRRGKTILQRLLCGTLPPPPPNVPPPKPASAGGTTRERFAEHDKQACAQGCHDVMDPIGFAFEHYDGIGKYRTLDNGKPVDSTGALKLGGTSQPFADAVELAGLLATSQEARSCFVTQWARFAFARTETDADQFSLDGAAAKFAAANGAVRELLVGVATSRSFLYRSPAPGEMIP